MISWIDLETSGLEPVGGCIIEAALVITDDDLNPIYQRDWLIGPPAPPSPDSGWETFAYDMHMGSGLLPLAMNSTYDHGRVSQDIGDAINQNGAAGSPMGGSSVHFDRAWLTVHMPYALAAFGYRNIDVSTLKELVNRWYPTMAAQRPTIEPKPHRALEDILASIEELRWYRANAFVPNVLGVNA